MFLGIEIGGTKLQLGVGRGDGAIAALWRGTVASEEGGEGIRRQIVAAVPELLAKAHVDRGDLRGIGIGFGGPTDDASQTVITSHQIEGWDGFPLAAWVSDLVGGTPAVLCNDADVAGLAEALFGAGKGLSPIFYITVGTGVGGGLIVDGQIYRGVGRGAAEIGHLRLRHPTMLVNNVVILPLERYASGEAIAAQAAFRERIGIDMTGIRKHCPTGPLTAWAVAAAAREGDAIAQRLLDVARQALAEGICNVIALSCPRRIVIGGGVSLMGDDLFFQPLRELVAARVFQPFAGLHRHRPRGPRRGNGHPRRLALAKQKLGG